MFLAIAVIVLSLLAASVGIPRLLRHLPNLPQDDRHAREQVRARRRAARAASREIDSSPLPLMLLSGAGPDVQVHLRALQAEREELHRLLRRRQINDETLRHLVRELDLAEMALRGAG